MQIMHCHAEDWSELLELLTTIWSRYMSLYSSDPDLQHVNECIRKDAIKGVCQERVMRPLQHHASAMVMFSMKAC